MRVPGDIELMINRFIPTGGVMRPTSTTISTKTKDLNRLASGADQLAETARRHYAGRAELMLVAVDLRPLGDEDQRPCRVAEFV